LRTPPLFPPLCPVEKFHFSPLRTKSQHWPTALKTTFHCKKKSHPSSKPQSESFSHSDTETNLVFVSSDPRVPPPPLYMSLLPYFAAPGPPRAKDNHDCSLIVSPYPFPPLNSLGKSRRLVLPSHSKSSTFQTLPPRVSTLKNLSLDLIGCCPPSYRGKRLPIEAQTGELLEQTSLGCPPPKFATMILYLL